MHAVSAPVAGLAPSTTYHFRLVATSAAGTSETADRTFTTPQAPADGGDGGDPKPGDGGDPKPGDGDGQQPGDGQHPSDGGDKPGDGGNPAPVPAPPAAAFTGVAVGGGTVKVGRSGIATIRLRCPAAAQGSCAGRLALKAKLRGRSRTIGTARFELAAGGSATVRVRISRAARTLIAGGRRLKASASATAHDSRNASVTSTAKLKLRRAR
jgi:hypothetical protein